MERNNESWAGFKGELWKKEINVRDFFPEAVVGEDPQSVEQIDRDVQGGA